LYLFSGYAICTFNPETQNTTSVLRMSEEAPDLSPISFGSTVMNNGTILFGSHRPGFGSLYPDQIVSSHPIDLRIVDFQLLNQKKDQVQTQEDGRMAIPDLGDKLVLAHNQNSFAFRFFVPDYRDPSSNRFEFKLENYDENWRQSTNQPEVIYYLLPSGDYTLHARMTGIKGSGSKQLALAIKILAPWWQRWWAYSIYILLFCLGIFGVHNFQKTRIAKKERERTRDRELAQAKKIERAYEELRTTQAQLIQSEKMASLGELTAGIAHEIQNPLNFVNNFSEVNTELAEELAEEAQKSKLDGSLISELAGDIVTNQEKINHHGQRASAIVKGMLEHSRSGDGKKEPTDLNALADEYLRLAYHGLRAKDKSFQADFKTKFAEDLPKIDVVPQDIGRVLLNLINNAFYAVDRRSKEGIDGYKPVVIVSSKVLKGSIEISVKDNGPGIPGEIKDKIFQPFFTTKPTGEGTGLGLSLSYDIVTKGHGGELHVETLEGEGTTFTIKLS